MGDITNDTIQYAKVAECCFLQIGFDISFHLLIIDISIFSSNYNKYRKECVYNMI